MLTAPAIGPAPEPSPIEKNCGLEVVPMFCGVESVTAPVDEDTIT